MRQDRLVTIYARAWSFFDENRRLVYGFLGGLVVIALLAGGYVYYMQQQQEEAQQLLGQVIGLYEQGNYQQALNGADGQMGLLEIVESYGGTAAGNMATFYAADALYQLGKYERALELFEQFEAEETVLGASAVAGIAAAYENLQQYTAAAEHYLKAAQLFESSATTPQYLFDAARAFAAAGSYDRAIEVYKKLEEQYPDAADQFHVQRHIARVKAVQ